MDKYCAKRAFSVRSEFLATMCERYKYSDHNLAGVLAEFQVAQDIEIQERWNMAPTMEGPVVTHRADRPAALEMMRWGMVSGKSSAVIQFRAETVATKGTFKFSLHRRRCLVIADGFYEWDKTCKPPQPIEFTLPGQPMVMAGIWDTVKLSDGQEVDAYAILTTAANRTVARVHDRMPVILSDKAARAAWLNPMTPAEALPGFYHPCAEELRERPVSPQLNNTQFQDQPEDVPAAAA